MCGRTWSKTLDILNDKTTSVKLQCDKLKRTHSPEVCHKFLVLSIYRSSTYGLLHSLNDSKNNLDCIIIYMGNPEGNISLITVYIIMLVHNIHGLFTVILSCYIDIMCKEEVLFTLVYVRWRSIGIWLQIILIMFPNSFRLYLAHEALDKQKSHFSASNLPTLTSIDGKHNVLRLNYLIKEVIFLCTPINPKLNSRNISLHKRH